jgi:hypothetical protein
MASQVQKAQGGLDTKGRTYSLAPYFSGLYFRPLALMRICEKPSMTQSLQDSEREFKIF